MKGVQIHNYSCTERRREEDSSSYGDHKLFLSENRFEVMRVDCGVASIPPFRIDVPSSSESIQFGAKTTRVKPDDKVELGEVLRLLHLSLGQYLGNRKILKVFIIHNNIDGIGQTFQIVLPNLESFKDSEQFLVIYVIIQLHCSKSVGVKGNWMNFIIFINNREDCSKSIVQGISFHDELSIRNPMSKDRSGGECFLERVESISTGGVELPRNVLLGEACEWNDNIQVVEDEPVVKVCEA